TLFLVDQIQTSSSGSLYCGGFSSTALTTLKIAVFRPIPSASVRTAMRVNPGDLRSWRRAKRISFISLCAKRFDRNDQSCAARWQQTRDERDRGKQDRRAAEQRGIVRRNFEELRRDQASQRKRGRNSNHESDQDRAHALVNNQFEHVARLRPEGHAHADFAGALLDAIRDRAVNSNGREEERDPGEYA